MSQSDEEQQVVARQTARSGMVDYATEILLHDTKDSRIVLLPIFIPHNSGPDRLTIKVVRYTKQRWTKQLQESQVINLNEAAVDRLLSELPRMAALTDHPSGEYLVVPLQGEFHRGDLDPGTIATAIARILADPDLRNRFADADLDHELVTALRSTIRLRDLGAAVNELRGYLHTGIEEEAVYQQWCQRHSWAFGTMYQDADELRQIAVGDTVDVLMPTLTGYRDIIELKRPGMEVLRRDTTHRNWYWSAQTSAAIGQCHRYLEQATEQLRTGLRDHPQVVAHYPRATIVIGRSAGWNEEIARTLHGLNARLNGITVITFDHLLAQADRLLQIVTENQPTT